MEPQPIGVGVIVLDKEGTHVLLGKRLNAYRAGQLGLPGGRLDLEETLRHCAERELLEETGLQASRMSYLGVVRELQEGYNFIHFAFVCLQYEGIPEVKEPEKCENWQWYPLDNLPKNIIRGHQATLDLYLHQEKSYRDINTPYEARD
jgi:8-oxo-dGTP diphosphatase